MTTDATSGAARADDQSVTGLLRALGPAALGVATEVFGSGEYGDLVARATSWSTETVELSALTDDELDSAAEFLRRGPPAVGQLSLHAPVALAAGGEEWLLARLSEVKGRLAAVIQHPHILGEPRRLAPLGRRLVLENMDVQKEEGRDVPELESYFRALPEAGFCLDVAHVKTVDPTMKLADELLDAYGQRLRELHVSGIRADGTHVPLDVDAVESYAPVLYRCRQVPWILESLPADGTAA